MDDTLQDDKTALALGALLRDHRGGDVAVLDMRGLNSWTDFFVIATASSETQLQGLERHVKDFAGEYGPGMFRRSQRPQTGDQWCLIDMGTIVVHLMTAQARAFYELERLWSAAPRLSLPDSGALGA